MNSKMVTFRLINNTDKLKYFMEINEYYLTNSENHYIYIKV